MYIKIIAGHCNYGTTCSIMLQILYSLWQIINIMMLPNISHFVWLVICHSLLLYWIF